MILQHTALPTLPANNALRSQKDAYRLSQARSKASSSRASAPQIDEHASVQIPELRTSTPNVVIIGGTGRVGSSTASALLAAVPGANISLASRSADSYAAAVQSRPDLRGTRRLEADLDSPSSLLACLKGADLVVLAAGPFQRREDCAVLEAAIAAGVPYLDVCDDTAWSKRAKSLSLKAEQAGVPAITTGGIYPGVSNVMAAHMISLARKEYSGDGCGYLDTPSADAARPSRVLYSYFTAGTGGAGPTILKTTFLLAGEEVVAYKDGKAVTLPAVSNLRVVDFGPGVGRRSLFLYSLPEVASGRAVFDVPSISARFGTAPDIWNWGMWVLARVVPRGLLSDPGFVASIARLADPIVRAVDGFVGEQVAMLVEVETTDGKVAAGLFVHPKLSESVGICISAFARCMLADQTSPGVHFPEERGALKDRRVLLTMAAQGTSRFLLNKPVWQIESEPKQLGMDCTFLDKDVPSLTEAIASAFRR